MNVDAVVVSFRSRETLRGAVELLAHEPDVCAIVVDNASDDNSLETVSDLAVTLAPLERNLGFAAGCNRGWRLGSSAFVLFLNPDARIEPRSVRELAAVLEADPSIGIVAPLVRGDRGEVEYSQRRFPRLRSTFAQALFLHRVFRRATWTDELIRDPNAYTGRTSVDWVSGACLLIRRDVLERLEGWDERFFMYCEDIDLCRRTRDLGYEVVFEPAAVAVHAGGASAPRAALLPTLAWSRVLYAEKHSPRPIAVLERIGVVLGSVTHALLSSAGRAARRGHLRAAVEIATGVRRGTSTR